MAEAGKNFILRLPGTSFWIVRWYDGWGASTQLEHLTNCPLLSSYHDKAGMTNPSRWSHSTGEAEQYEVCTNRVNRVSTRLSLIPMSKRTTIVAQPRSKHAHVTQHDQATACNDTNLTIVESLRNSLQPPLDHVQPGPLQETRPQGQIVKLEPSWVSSR